MRGEAGCRGRAENELDHGAVTGCLRTAGRGVRIDDDHIRPAADQRLQPDDRGPEPTTWAPGLTHSKPCRNGSGNAPTTTGTLKPPPDQDR